MKYLALSIPGYNISAPGGIPDSGLHGAGQNILGVTISILLLLATLLALFYLVYGGFRWMMSGGDKEKLAIARLTIIYAILGLVISFISFMIMNVIGMFLGVNLLSF